MSEKGTVVYLQDQARTDITCCSFMCPVTQLSVLTLVSLWADLRTVTAAIVSLLVQVVFTFLTGLFPAEVKILAGWQMYCACASLVIELRPLSNIFILDLTDIMYFEKSISSCSNKLLEYMKFFVFHVVGLDAAGKTTILYKLKLGEIVTTIPTIGKYN